MTKSFKGGLETLLGGMNKEAQKDEPVKAQESPTASNNSTAPTQESGKREGSVYEGTYEGDIKATFIIKEAKLETLKALAYWERKKMKDLLDEAVGLLIKNTDKELLNKAIKEYKNSKEIK